MGKVLLHGNKFLRFLMQRKTLPFWRGDCHFDMVVNARTGHLFEQAVTFSNKSSDLTAEGTGRELFQIPDIYGF